MAEISMTRQKTNKPKMQARLLAPLNSHNLSSTPLLLFLDMFIHIILSSIHKLTSFVDRFHQSQIIGFKLKFSVSMN